MYIILLKKLRFSCSGKGGIHWQYRCPSGTRLWKGWEPLF